MIFIAGHATTAVAMTFVWYLLSKHPWAEAKLHQELATGVRGRPPKYRDCLNFSAYTRQVIQEAMRLYPPAPSLEARKLVADDVLCGCHIPKGAQVAIMPWILHRHRTLWDEPDRFEPDRFSPENSAGRDRFAWLPFGGGPRICIGAALALTEGIAHPGDYRATVQAGLCRGSANHAEGADHIGNTGRYQIDCQRALRKWSQCNVGGTFAA